MKSMIVTLGLCLGACMSTTPPQELVDARAAYARAYVGPAAEANVVGLHDAKRALDDAEAKFQEDPSSEETRHLAYLAHRRVLIVETNARATIAGEQRERAENVRAAAAQARTTSSNSSRCTLPSRKRPCRFLERVEWLGTRPSSPRRQNQR